MQLEGAAERHRRRENRTPLISEDRHGTLGGVGAPLLQRATLQPCWRAAVVRALGRPSSHG